MRISPNLIFVPCASAVAFRYLSGMDPVLKASYGIAGFWASRQEWKSRRTPRPTIPCSAMAVVLSANSRKGMFLV
jgi:hypothetical protein